MLGYKLTPNFAMPFLSRNLGEFWRRWHMSLSSWLRDYLFIPLGGSRGSTLFVCRNLIITMTIGGLWHGANWNMVLWGTLMGLLLCLHRIFNLFIQPWPSFNSFLRSTYLTPICVGCTLLLFVLSLVVFRTPSLRATGFMFEGLLGGQGTQAAPLPLRSLLVTILLLIVGHAWGVYLRDNRFAWRRLFRTAPPSLLGFAYAGMVTLAIVLGPGSSKAFIYFQF
jgi:alginate O-acetyltransferase complex protein AlgI